MITAEEMAFGRFYITIEFDDEKQLYFLDEEFRIIGVQSQAFIYQSYQEGMRQLSEAFNWLDDGSVDFTMQLNRLPGGPAVPNKGNA